MYQGGHLTTKFTYQTTAVHHVNLQRSPLYDPAHGCYAAHVLRTIS